MSNKSANRRINIYINDKEVVNSFAGIQKALRKSNNELRNMTRGTKEYQNKVKEVKGLNKVLASHRNSISGVNRSWQNMKGIMVGAVGAWGITAGIQKLLQVIPDVIQRNYDLSDSLTDVQKVTGLTEVEMKELYTRLGKFDTRTSRKQLLELAWQAGKLGVKGVADLTAFVRASDKINVALGKDLGDGAIKQIGKLNQVFGITDTMGLEESMERTGSAINALGMDSTAAEQFLVNFTTRVAGMSKQAGIAIPDVLGLASTIDQLGLKAEMSSTAIGKTLVLMFKETEKFAGIAQMGYQEFSDLLKNDANQAFMKVVQGLNGNNEGLGVMTKLLDGVGINGARAISTLSALASNTELLAKTQKFSNNEFTKATSLQNEFNMKNNNAAATIDKLGKKMRKYFMSTTLVDGMKSLTKAALDFVTVPVAEELNKERMATSLLFTEAVSLGDQSKRRHDIIRDLQAKYPQYLGNIDAETVSNTKLLSVMAQINEHAIKRIFIEKEKEKLLELQENTADLLEPELKAKQDHAVKLKTLLDKMTAEQGDFFLRSRQNLSVELDLIKESSGSTAEQVIRLGQIFEQYNVTGIKPNDFLLLESYNNTYIEKLQERLESEEIAAQKAAEINRKAQMFGLYDDPGLSGKKPSEVPKSTTEIENEGDISAAKERVKTQKKLQKELLKLQKEFDLLILEDIEKQKEVVNQKYDELIQQAKDGGIEMADELIALETLKQAELDIIDAEHVKKKEEAQKDASEFIRNLTLDDTELQIQAEKDKQEAQLLVLKEYLDDKLISEEEHAQALIDLEKKTQEAITKIKENASKSEVNTKSNIHERFAAWKKKYDDIMAKDAQKRTQAEIDFLKDSYGAKMMLAHNFANFLGQVSQFIGKEGEAMTDFQKGLALAQIAIDTAVGISGVIRMAVRASDPFSMAAYIVSGFGMLFAGMNQAKSVLAPVSTPELDSNKPPGFPGFAKGTNYAPGGLSWVGEEGPELVNLPRGSQVFTASQSKSIANSEMNTDAALQAVNGYADADDMDTAPTFSPNGMTQGSLHELIVEVKRVGEKLDGYESRKEIILSHKKYEKDKTRIALIKTMRNIGKTP